MNRHFLKIQTDVDRKSTITPAFKIKPGPELSPEIAKQALNFILHNTRCYLYVLSLLKKLRPISSNINIQLLFLYLFIFYFKKIN
jgi:hypothetical protein